jgi:hypothetical protein
MNAMESNQKFTFLAKMKKMRLMLVVRKIKPRDETREKENYGVKYRKGFKSCFLMVRQSGGKNTLSILSIV